MLKRISKFLGGSISDTKSTYWLRSPQIDWNNEVTDRDGWVAKNVTEVKMKSSFANPLLVSLSLGAKTNV